MAEPPVILLTNAIHPDGLALLTPFARVVLAPDTGFDTLRRLAADADGIIVRALLPDDICAHAPRLRALVRHGVGIDFVPVAAATAHGVPVTSLPGANANAVAEYAVAALLHLRRGLAGNDALLRREGWNAARPAGSRLAEIGGGTLGIVGLGAIGRRLADIARLGFGMRVLGATRRASSVPDGVEPADLDTLFARSDAVVLACPLTPETRNLVDRARLARMRPGAVLVNVARGGVVDTAALAEALAAGTLAGAALDVFDTEPLPPDSPLFALPNLLLTPHIAGLSANSTRALGIRAAEDMRAILHGERPHHLVNPEVWPA
ncbi:MAG: NAD(P)-dependent oxidoreductase [Janthinobacterium lividum]